ncbi:MFS transporter [Microvirga sp. 3-52]|uniref:MFS transporter n=1 Tax=Microvirga sp. 3-52 TaxID=2792425 RepID=UPI001AC67649|nr:MFS transporter [Microvirga sp. 3-52]MBO1905326.1 MFS transporter [Microvirga sp. 3-52]MBS7452585.1 MFS transporter [Microvirga sp. 3-52]
MSVFAAPGMRALLATVALAFTGFSLLLPISPSWVIAGGASEVAAGSVTTTLMLFTILAQLYVNRALRSFGWTPILMAGVLFLSVPAPLQALSPSLAIVSVTSALRGVGFGIITVCGATALTLLVSPAHRGKAVGAYGLAAALPQLAFASSAPMLADSFGFPIVLILGTVPVLALIWLIPLGQRLTKLASVAEKEPPEVRSQSLGRMVIVIWPTLMALVIVTSTGGALLTFANQIAPNSKLATLALLLLTGFATPARWAGGALSDRFGTHHMIPALVIVTALAALTLSGSLLITGTAWNNVLLLAGAVLLGSAYGGLQSATLVRAFHDGGAANAAKVSVLWNVTFDLGTGIGALIVGAIAQSASFALALACLAILGLAGFAAIRVQDTTSRLDARS